MASTFAVIENGGHLLVIGISPTDQHHQIIERLGAVIGKRHATKLLSEAGYTTKGMWRTSSEGEDIRTVTAR